MSSFEAMVKDFTSFDRIKYRDWSAVYLTDMLSLKDSDDLENERFGSLSVMVISAAKSLPFLVQLSEEIIVESRKTERSRTGEGLRGSQ